MAIAVKAGKVYGLRKMSNIDNIKNYTVIDLEMTGLSAKNDKIIEIGCLLYTSIYKLASIDAKADSDK